MALSPLTCQLPRQGLPDAAEVILLYRRRTPGRDHNDPCPRWRIDAHLERVLQPRLTLRCRAMPAPAPKEVPPRLHIPRSPSARPSSEGYEAPFLPPLARSIDAAPTGDLAFIAGERGKPMTKESFGNWFREACQSAGVPGSAHGLRRAGPTRAAENGATTTGRLPRPPSGGLTTTCRPTTTRRLTGRGRRLAACRSWNGKSTLYPLAFPLTWAKRPGFSTKPEANKALAPRAGLEPATIR